MESERNALHAAVGRRRKVAGSCPAGAAFASLRLLRMIRPSSRDPLLITPDAYFPFRRLTADLYFLPRTVTLPAACCLLPAACCLLPTATATAYFFM